jgi:hypothetical protein
MVNSTFKLLSLQSTVEQILELTLNEIKSGNQLNENLCAALKQIPMHSLKKWFDYSMLLLRSRTKTAMQNLSMMEWKRLLECCKGTTSMGDFFLYELVHEFINCENSTYKVMLNEINQSDESSSYDR